MTKNLIIIGAGGFGIEVAAYAEDILRAGNASFVIKGFLDDTKAVGTIHAGYPVLGSTKHAVDPESFYAIALGTPINRKALFDKFMSRGAKFITLIHPQSYVAASAVVGEGAIITPFALVGPQTKIGLQCLLNVYATTGHESELGDFCVLSPYASTQGAASLGGCSFMGSNAVLTAGIQTGDNVKIAAGAVVYNDLPSAVLALGNPASYRLPTTP